MTHKHEMYSVGNTLKNYIIIIIMESISDNPQKNQVLLMIATSSFDSFDLHIYLFGNSGP